MELPLFDKLFGITSPSADNEFLSEKEFLASIKTEISRLLETRVSSDLSHRGNYNITKYGIPDSFFSELKNDLQVKRAENYLGSLVEYFEPRVFNVSVKILEKRSESASAEISFDYEYNGELFGVEFKADM